MGARRFLTTLIQRLQNNPHHSPSIRDLHTRLERYFLAATDPVALGQAGTRQAAEVLVARVLKRLRSFDPRSQHSADWIERLILELETEFQAVLRDAKVLRAVINRLHAENAERKRALPAYDPAASEEDRIKEQAISRVQNSGQFEDKTWFSYWYYDHEDRDHKEIAAALGIRPDTVFRYVTRVRKAIKAEIERLQTEGKHRGKRPSPD